MPALSFGRDQSGSFSSRHFQAILAFTNKDALVIKLYGRLPERLKHFEKFVDDHHHSFGAGHARRFFAKIKITVQMAATQKPEDGLTRHVATH
jgi:hypothetical protein